MQYRTADWLVDGAMADASGDAPTYRQHLSGALAEQNRRGDEGVPEPCHAPRLQKLSISESVTLTQRARGDIYQPQSRTHGGSPHLRALPSCNNATNGAGGDRWRR